MPSQAPSHAPSIRALPTQVVNQIAAGEVIERPASVVKELIDNALDAEASRIEVELERGGIESAQVADDGSGIAADELPAAVAPHATSKITDAEQLASIRTLGFRGEALSAIASVSRLSIRSRPPHAEAAAGLEVEGGDLGQVRPQAGPIGTTVAARHLFFNTPARRKFLRTPSTEQSHVVETVRSLAIAHPNVAFSLTCDGRSALDLPAGQTPFERAAAALGADLADQVIEVRAGEEDGQGAVRLWGLAGRPETARATTRAQRFFVNGRPVRDRTLQHAVQEAYRGLIEPARKPLILLLIETDPSLVDVNVHPAKGEVRFRDQSLIHSLTLRSVREALRRADLTRAWTDDQRAPSGDAATPTRGWSASDFAESIKRLDPQQPGGFDYDSLRAAVQREEQTARDDHPPATSPNEPQPAGRALQIHDSFLVTQDDSGVLIIDQHALHERVMFEKIISRVRDGSLESQRLLTPATLEISASRLETADRLRPMLERLGVELAPIGPSALAIQAFPTLLFDRKVDPAEFLDQLLDKAEDNDIPGDDESAVHEVVDMMACKAAVKAGDPLSDEEMAELLRMRDRVERSSNCPHGRPTSIRLTLKDLERRFGRT